MAKRQYEAYEVDSRSYNRVLFDKEHALEVAQVIARIKGEGQVTVYAINEGVYVARYDSPSE